MTTTQRLLQASTRPMLRLSEVERLIRIHRIIIPPLSRRALTGLCEDGTLETARRRTVRDPYLVFEDSFLDWVGDLNATDK